MASAGELREALAEYRVARLRLLGHLDRAVSNRDPLSEFAERLVAAVLGGTLAENRNQPGWDVSLQDGSTVQVKYLANPVGRWVNEHPVRRIPEADWYGLVLIEDFAVAGILMFPSDGLAPISAALGKRHPNTGDQLQLTRVNWLAIASDPQPFRDLGMRVLLPPDLG